MDYSLAMTPAPVLRTAYWHDAAARQSFQEFIRQIFDMDFGAWDTSGYWDDDYRPYSYFVGDRVAASMCIYTMHARVNGETCTLAQVSGVGTLPEFRKQGLNRRLHEIALAEALQRHRFAFLAADDDAVTFYRKCGFRPVTVYAPVVPLPAIATDPGIEKLDPNDGAVLDEIFRLACERPPVSQVFSTSNPKLVMWHVLYRLRNRIFRIPALDAVIFMKHDGAKAIVYDILARELPRFEQLAPFLAADGVGEVEFRFPVDLLDVPASTLRELPGENAHVMGNSTLGAQPIFPFTTLA